MELLLQGRKSYKMNLTVVYFQAGRGRRGGHEAGEVGRGHFRRSRTKLVAMGIERGTGYKRY